MSRYTITPWRTQADLLEVRKQLYNSNEANQTSRRRAVDRVMAWKLRGNLPHAVESTALLIDAILHHDIKTNSIFSIRAVYSAAFTRFVTGFCDIGRHKERTLEPSSMLNIAKQIGMPVEFVALRHEATHEEMPGIQRLVSATREALSWLWKVYWARLEEPEDEHAAQASFASTKAELVATLKEFRRARRDALRSKSQPSAGGPSDFMATSSICVEMCKGSRGRIAGLAGILVDARLILPTTRELGASLDGAYLIWDELLTDMCSRLRGFLPALIAKLLQSLSSITATDSASDVDKDALAMWLLHLMSDEFMSIASVDHDALVVDAMKWCCLHPGYWTQHVGRQLLGICDENVHDEWEDLFEASLIKSNADTAEIPSLHAQQTSVVTAEKDTPSGENGIRTRDGWSRAIVPLHTPIGVVL